MESILHTAKRTFISVILPPIGYGWGIIDGKCCPMRNALPELPASLPSQSAQSDEDSSDSDDIEDCSETDSTKSENDE